MKARWARFICGLLISCSLLSCSGQQTPPADTIITSVNSTDTSTVPAPLGFVSDYGAIYTPAQRQYIDSLLHDFEDSSSVQLALFTFTQQMIKDVKIDDYLLNIANSWKIGHSGKNNGILVGICAECRSMRIENGFGIEQLLSNSETKKIIETAFFPDFKKEEYYKGTINGLQTLMQLLHVRTRASN